VPPIHGYGASPKTLNAYTHRLGYMLEFDGITPLNQVDQGYWERYRRFLRTRLKSDRYVHHEPTRHGNLPTPHRLTGPLALQPEVMEKLKVYCEGKQEHDLLFPNTFGHVEGHFLKKCQAIAKRDGLTGFNLHRWRKTGATIMYKRGVPVPLISKFLGHEDLKVTQMYLDISDEATDYMVDKVTEIFAAA
jgi:hypothetical protein